MNQTYFSLPESGNLGESAIFSVQGIESESCEYTTQYLLDHGHELPKDEYFNAARELALANALELLEHWLPDGELRGSEYKAYNPLRMDSSLGSFSINVESGVWADFATDDKGRDLISLVQYLGELEFYSDAAREVLKFLAGQATLNKALPARAKKAEKTPEYTLVMPIPEAAMPKRARYFGAELGSPVAEWTYRNAKGQPLFFVLRFNLPGNQKEYRPYSYCVDSTGAGSWRLKAPATNRPAYGLDRLAARPDAVVLFTEGEKSADAAQRLFPDWVVVTTMNGAKSPDKTDFSPFAGRKVLIAPDNDEAGIAYKDRLVELLRGAGARVAGFLRIDRLAKDGTTLPAGYDLADADADGWTGAQLEALGREIWEPIPLVVTKPIVEKAAPDSEQSPQSALSVVEPGKTIATETATKKSTPPKKKHGLEYAVDFATVHHKGHVAAFCNQVLAYIDGHWKALNPDVEIKKPLLQAMGVETTAGKVNGVLDLLRIQYATEPALFERNSPLICLNNGTLNPMTAELLGHEPGHYLTNKMAIDFHPNEDCKLWLQTLDEIFAPDADKVEKIQLLQEFMGYCMIPDTRLHQFLWLVGSGGNGKSLILAILTALIGKENISYAQIERLQEKFVRAELQGKLVNISSEMSAQATVADGYLKQITSGDIIEAERKNEKPFSFKPYARLVGATNVLPRLLDHSDGFFRRAMIIRFNRQFSGAEKDNQREAKLMAELPGILNWALAGLQRLLKRGEYVIPPSSELEIRQYRVNSDPVRQFSGEFLQPTDDKGRWVASGELYQHYVAWSRDNGYKTLASNQFAERLVGVGIIKGRTGAGRFWHAEFVSLGKGTQPSSVSPMAQQYIV